MKQDSKNNGKGNGEKIFYFSQYNFLKDKEYKEEIFGVLDQLDQMEENFTGMMINLACKDKWSEWVKTQKEGSSFSFSDEMLAQTGDESVNVLFELREDIRNGIEKIKLLNRIKEKK
jgi:hypothetical protein